MKRFLLALGAMLVLTGGAGDVQNSPSGSANTVNPYEGDPEAIQSGAALFRRVSCHGCHSGNARGGTGPDLTDDVWMRQPSDEMIFNVIKFGRRGTLMSPFKDDLDDDQIWHLVAYIRELGRLRKAEGD